MARQLGCGHMIEVMVALAADAEKGAGIRIEAFGGMPLKPESAL